MPLAFCDGETRPGASSPKGVLKVLLGQYYLSKCPTPLAAYNNLQAALMRRFLRRGGTIERWVAVFAPRFRHRYGWICEQPVPVTQIYRRIPR